MRELEDVALAFDRACRQAGLDYAFVGGLAVMAWGQPRATVDIDVLLDYTEEDVHGLDRALGDEDLTVQQRDLRLSLEDGSHVTVFDEHSRFHVDVKPALGDLERDEVDRAEEVRFEGAHLRFAPPEETIAFKLHFGSPRDLEDARSVLARQRERIDEDRLTELARRLGVEDELAALRAEVDEVLDGTGGES